MNIKQPAFLGEHEHTENGAKLGLWAWHHQLWFVPTEVEVTAELFGTFSDCPKPKVTKGYYRHFKGDFYLVSGVGRVILANENGRVILTRDMFVAYESVEDPVKKWARPAAMFLDAVSGSREERNAVWRFQIISTH